MQVVDSYVVLQKSELSICPKEKKWGVQMLRIYGLTNLRGRLEEFSRCPAILSEAGFKAIIVGSLEEELKVVHKLQAAKSTEEQEKILEELMRD